MKNLALCVCVLLLATAGAGAATFPFAAAQVEIASPDGWNTSQEGDAVTFTSPDKEMTVVFQLLPAGVETKTIEAIDKELDKAIGDVAWSDKPTEEKINGMDVEIHTGTAKEGKIVVEANYIDTPAERMLAAYWFSTPEADKKYEKEIETIVKGLKPTGAAAPAASPAAAEEKEEK